MSDPSLATGRIRCVGCSAKLRYEPNASFITCPRCETRFNPRLVSPPTTAAAGPAGGRFDDAMTGTAALAVLAAVATPSPPASSSNSATSSADKDAAGGGRSALKRRATEVAPFHMAASSPLPKQSETSASTASPAASGADSAGIGKKHKVRAHR